MLSAYAVSEHFSMGISSRQILELGLDSAVQYGALERPGFNPLPPPHSLPHGLGSLGPQPDSLTTPTTAVYPTRHLILSSSPPVRYSSHATQTAIVLTLGSVFRPACSGHVPPAPGSHVELVRK